MEEEIDRDGADLHECRTKKKFIIGKTKQTNPKTPEKRDRKI